MSLRPSYCQRCGREKTSPWCICEQGFDQPRTIRPGPTTLAALFHEHMLERDKRIAEQAAEIERLKEQVARERSYGKDWATQARKQGEQLQAHKDFVAAYDQVGIETSFSELRKARERLKGVRDGVD